MAEKAKWNVQRAFCPFAKRKVQKTKRRAQGRERQTKKERKNKRDRWWWKDKQALTGLGNKNYCGHRCSKPIPVDWPKPHTRLSTHIPHQLLHQAHMTWGERTNDGDNAEI